MAHLQTHRDHLRICRALLQTYQDHLRMCRALLCIYRALMRIYTWRPGDKVDDTVFADESAFGKYVGLFCGWICRALLRIYRALLRIYTWRRGR